MEEVVDNTQTLTGVLLDNERRDVASMSHFLMWRLSTLLPDKMRGVYSPDKLKGTLLGRYELAMKDKRNDRSVQIYDNWEQKFLDA